MLDLLTLQKSRNWLKKRQDDLLHPTRPYNEYDQVRIHQLGELIEELDEKIHAIEVEQSIRPEENGVMLVSEKRNEKRYYCKTCHVEHSVYRIQFTQVHIRILRKIFSYCVTNGTNIIEKKKIPGLTHTDYGNFYALRRFGLLYWKTEEDGRKIKGGHWWVAVKRINDFLTGKWRVAEYAEMNMATKEGKVSANRVYISDIANYTDLERDNITGLPYFISYEENKDLFTSDNNE